MRRGTEGSNVYNMICGVVRPVRHPRRLYYRHEAPP